MSLGEINLVNPQTISPLSRITVDVSGRIVVAWVQGIQTPNGVYGAGDYKLYIKRYQP